MGMENIIIETAVQILACLIVTLLGVLGTWVSAKIAKRNELTNIGIATNEAITAAQQTVFALQQTVVEKWKAASADGKLTEEEVTQLGIMLVQKTMEKMSEPAKNLLRSAGVDIIAIIKDAGEAMILGLKQSTK